MKVFFDLDGTLIDSKIRVYTLFSNLVKTNKLSFEDYWNLKKSMFPNDWILENLYSYSFNDIKEFNSKWLINIEKEGYLKLDSCFNYTIDTLSTLKCNNLELFLITSRQNEREANSQIVKLGLSPYFKDIMITCHKVEKHELIRQKRIKVESSDYFIGDTGKDIETGKELGLITVGVLSGFRNYESLIKYNPDHIIKNISEFPVLCK
jgi:phosphoglycolate phosphatase